MDGQTEGLINDFYASACCNTDCVGVVNLSSFTRRDDNKVRRLLKFDHVQVRDTIHGMEIVPLCYPIAFL